MDFDNVSINDYPKEFHPRTTINSHKIWNLNFKYNYTRQLFLETCYLFIYIFELSN